MCLGCCRSGHALAHDVLNKTSTKTSTACPLRWRWCSVPLSDTVCALLQQDTIISSSTSLLSMPFFGKADETGKVILGNLPPGFLDDKGKELRDALDVCLEKNMWFFSIGGLLLTLPICIKYKTERPFFAAAITCPVADLYFGTLRCNEENEAFRQHYNYLQEVYTQPAWKREKQQQQQQQQPQQQEEQEQQQRSSWHPSDDAQAQQGQQQGSWWWGWRRQE